MNRLSRVTVCLGVVLFVTQRVSAQSGNESVDGSTAGALGDVIVAAL
jgi:hypothetical protein